MHGNQAAITKQQTLCPTGAVLSWLSFRFSSFYVALRAVLIRLEQGLKRKV
jgi:hypothetical protein